MDISNYHLGDVYKTKVLLREYNTDSQHSYQTTASMSGPGNGPTTGATDQSPNNFDTQVMFPKDTELSNADKKSLLIKFLKDEIDNGNFNRGTKAKFKDLYDHLLGAHAEDEVKPKKVKKKK